MIKKTIYLLTILIHGGILYAQDQLKPLGSALENFDYPLKVKYISLELQHAGKLFMAYMDTTPDNYNGKNIMLLHGKNFCAAYWEQTAADLAKNGFRVILPDQIGFGKSSKPENIQYTFQLLASNTHRLLDSLNIKKIIVVGHSMGGMIATRFALMYPEMTEKLILVNPIGLEDWKVKVPYQPVEYWYKNEMNKSYSSIKSYMQENYYHGEWKSVYEPWLLLQSGWTLSPEYPRLAWVSALTYDMIFTQPVVYEFKFLKMPVLLIIGQADRTALGKNLVDPATRETMGNYPELGKRTQEMIPKATLIELEGVGHLPQLEAYDRFFGPLYNFIK